MVYAEFQDDPRFLELLHFLKARFVDVEHGLQGDYYIWITDGAMKVAIDNFTSLLPQVKSDPQSTELLTRVISTLGPTYKLRIFDPPAIEAHE